MTEPIVIEANSFGEAKEQAKSQIPEGFYLRSIKIISGEVGWKKIYFMADTTEFAISQARSQLPNDATNIKEEVILSPEHEVITVETFSEAEAESIAKSKATELLAKWKPKNYWADHKATISSPKLTLKGKSGFLGIGKAPNQYEIVITRQARIVVSYTRRVKISAELSKMDELPNDFDSLVTEMIDLLAEAQNWSGKRDKLFFEFPQYEQAQEIGRRLYAIGGIECMRKAYAIIDQNCTRRRISTSEHWWDNIGGWHA